MKLRPRYDAANNPIGFYFKCPACNEYHAVGPSWMFNGNHDAPTFRPSILVTGPQAINNDLGEWTGEYVRDESGVPKRMKCHSFITDGRIEFLSDCNHALAGTTVELPEVT